MAIRMFPEFPETPESDLAIEAAASIVGEMLSAGHSRREIAWAALHAFLKMVEGDDADLWTGHLAAATAVVNRQGRRGN